MAKKKRTTKRSTRATKRRPIAKRKRKANPVKQENTEPVVTNFDPTPYQIAARQRGLSAAVQATIGGAETPLPLRAGTGEYRLNQPIIETPPPPAISAAPIDGKLEVSEDADRLEAEGIVFPPPIPITPTIYPDSPDGKIIVHNHITINIESVEFGQFDSVMEELVTKLLAGGSNEISDDVRAKLLSEMTAGRELLEGPKPSRDLIDLLLVRPLRWLADKAGGAAIGALAVEALHLLSKMMM